MSLLLLFTTLKLHFGLPYNYLHFVFLFLFPKPTRTTPLLKLRHQMRLLMRRLNLLRLMKLLLQNPLPLPMKLIRNNSQTHQLKQNAKRYYYLFIQLESEFANLMGIFLPTSIYKGASKCLQS